MRGMNESVDLFVRCEDKLPEENGLYRIKHNCGANEGNGVMQYSTIYGWDVPNAIRSFYRVIAWAPNSDLDGSRLPEIKTNRRET